MRYALMAATVLFLGGCMGTPSYVVKQMTVEKNPDGTVIKRIENEYVVQAVTLEEITLELLKVDKPKPAISPYSKSTSAQQNSAGGNW